MIDIIKNNPLFKGLNTKEIEQLLECLNSYKKEYKKIKQLYVVERKYIL